VTDAVGERLPIARAKEIAERHDLDQVILVAWSKKDGRTHVVTYGRSLEDSAQAAEGGNRVKRALGWPETLCNAVPARVRRARGGRRG
jgi:hypothetical protein